MYKEGGMEKKIFSNQKKKNFIELKDIILQSEMIQQVFNTHTHTHTHTHTQYLYQNLLSCNSKTSEIKILKACRGM